MTVVNHSWSGLKTSSVLYCCGRLAVQIWLSAVSIKWREDFPMYLHVVVTVEFPRRDARLDVLNQTSDVAGRPLVNPRQRRQTQSL